MADSVFISPFPTLSPWAALSWPSSEPLPFPLADSGARYYYLARNGIYALAQRWKLRDEEVLFPAYFHGVEVDTLLAAGVKLRFYPVDANMKVNVEDVKSLTTAQTRAIYLIHYLGFPGPVEELSEFCRQRELPLIEDCALALLSQLGEKPLGSFGDAAVYCLYKTLPVPNGGVLVVRQPGSEPWPATKAPALASTLAYTATAVWRHLKFNGGWTHALLQTARSAAKRISHRAGVVPVGNEDFDLAKADLAMSGLCRKLLLHQDYAGVVERRRRNFSRMLMCLRDYSPPVFDTLPGGVCPLFYPVRTSNKAQMLQRLFDRGIEAVNFWSRVPAMIPNGAFPECERLRQTIVELPCHQDLSVQEIDRIADAVIQLQDCL
jgi:dTDP-4-amino-4,6-dideoxygalactose transaminase